MGTVSSSTRSVTINGVSFPLVNSVDTLCRAIENEGRGVLRFRTPKYREVLTSLFQKIRTQYGESRQLSSVAKSELVCANCFWAFPMSYKMSLQGIFSSPNVSGIFGSPTPG